MLRTFRVENYKSIDELELELGRFNVFIGENGCGKSNLLEALVVAHASVFNGSADGLAARGVRFTHPDLMVSRLFSDRGGITRLKSIGGDQRTGESAVVWTGGGLLPSEEEFGFVGSVSVDAIARFFGAQPSEREAAMGPALTRLIQRMQDQIDQPDFRIYGPENSALRSYQTETQLRPLGIRGEGLFAHLNDLSKRPDGPALVTEIASGLTMLDWFDKLEVPKDLAVGEQRVAIFDRYLAKGALFDQRSANEGFLFLLFYFTLFTSPEVPPVFAIDNIDTSLNPLLCTRLVKDLVGRAKKHDKQAFVTTHNPKILDGLDLNDDEQRLFVVERTKDGATRARRVSAPKPVGSKPPVALSEAFLRGYLGGVPKNF